MYSYGAAYGLSETFTIASMIPADAPAAQRRGSHGPALPGMRYRIVDPETGAELAPGKEGEIAVAGVTLMRGYQKVRPELIFDAEGFFRTQDGGSLDDAGRLHWTGRLSNLVKTGGANVSPLEIDEVIREFAGVKVSQTIGVPDELLGELVVACIVPHDGVTLDEGGIKDFAKQKLSSYKVPRRVLFFGEEELATTGSAKIKTADLRKLAAERLAGEQPA